MRDTILSLACLIILGISICIYKIIVYEHNVKFSLIDTEDINGMSQHEI